MKKTFSLLPLVACCIVMLPFTLSLSWCPDVEGLRVGDISSTVIHAKGLLQGYYLFWNHLDGLGMPHPYGTNLIYHPMVLLFGLFRFDFAILIFYLGHALLGAYSMWYLCAYFQMNKPISGVCVLTYLMSSPSLNYLIGTDLWPTCVVIWTGLPLLLLLLCKFFDTNDRHDNRSNIFGIVALTGFIAANSHIGALTYSMIGLLFFALANTRNLVHQWRSLLLILFLLVFILSEKLFMLYSEFSRFTTDGERFFQYLPPDILSMLFWPLKIESLENSYKAIHYRSFFMGFPFVFFALACYFRPMRLIPQQRAVAFAALGCLILLFVPPQWIPGQVIIANYLWRDPLILFFIILAGKFVSVLYQSSEKKRKLAQLVLILQIITLAVGISPHWTKGFRKGIDYWAGKPVRVLRTYVEKGPALAAVEKMGLEAGDRIALTDTVQSKLRYYSKFDYALFRIHQMPLVNGLFKGICYDDVSPSSRAMFGTLDATLFSERQSLLDVLSIAYLFAFEKEAVPQNLKPLNTFETKMGRVVLYHNNSAWPRASVMGHDAFEEGVGGSVANRGVLYQRFNGLESHIKKGKVIDLEQLPNRFNIQLAPMSDQSVLFINAYYRPSWKATGEISNKSLKLNVRSVLGGLIAVDLPAGISAVHLRYRPWVRLVLSMLCWVTLLGSSAICIILFYRRRASKFAFPSKSLHS